MTEQPDWPAMFDGLAEHYDQSGVPFFGTIAEGLVNVLAPAPGERALDIGCGRGAATFRLAERVGPSGHVDAIDLAPTMVRLTAREAAERGLDHVTVAEGDASDPPFEPGSYDLVTSSLVLFFLPDPKEAVRRWLRLLVPGGRVGAATFQPLSDTWRGIEDVFAEYAPAPLPLGRDRNGLFDSDRRLERLFSQAGAQEVRTETADYAIPFQDAAQWKRWSQGSPMRGLWLRTPSEAHAEILGRVGEVLDGTRVHGGPARVQVGVRYTLGKA